MEWYCSVLCHSCTKENLKWKQHTELSADYYFQTRILKILKVWKVTYKVQFLLKKEKKKRKKELGVGVIIIVIVIIIYIKKTYLNILRKPSLSREIKNQIMWFIWKLQGFCDSCLCLHCWDGSLLCITSMALKGQNRENSKPQKIYFPVRHNWYWIVSSKMFLILISVSRVILFISSILVSLEYFQLDFTCPRDARERKDLIKKQLLNR